MLFKFTRFKMWLMVLIFTVGTMILTIFSVQKGLTADSAGPALFIPSQIPAVPNSLVSVPVSFSANGNSIGSIFFSIDYNEQYLTFDPAVANAVTLNLGSDFTGGCASDLTDTDGEIDCFAYDPVPPLSPIPDGVFITIKLRTGNVSSPVVAAVNFSESSAPYSFGSLTGQSIAGTAQNGSVRINLGAAATKNAFLPFINKILPSATPTPTATPTRTITPTPTKTPLVSVTPTKTKTSTPSLTPTKTRTPTSTLTSVPACYDAILNGSFETTSAWYLPITEYTAAYSTAKARTGTRSLRTGIITAADNRYSYSSGRQAFTIPSNAKRADLKLYIYPISGETALNSVPLIPIDIFSSQFTDAPLANDLQYVLILNQYDQVLETIMWQRSNSQTWTLKQFDLLDYAGYTIKVEVGTYNDGYDGITTMYVDDVSLEICR
jgi:hypothetical protein